MVEASLVNLAELVVITVGVTIALIQLRDIKKTRQMEYTRAREENQIAILLTQLTQYPLAHNWVEVYTQNFKDYEEWQEKYGLYTNPEAYIKLASLTNYYKTLGTILRKKIVDVDVLLGTYSAWSVIVIWEKVEPLVNRWRETLDPEMWEPFEYLYNECVKYRDRNKNSK